MHENEEDICNESIERIPTVEELQTALEREIENGRFLASDKMRMVAWLDKISRDHEVDAHILRSWADAALGGQSANGYIIT